MPESKNVQQKSNPPRPVEVYVEPRQPPAFVHPAFLVERIISIGSNVLILGVAALTIASGKPLVFLAVILPAFVLSIVASIVVGVLHQRWLHQRLVSFHELVGPSFFTRGFNRTLRDCNWGDGIMQVGPGGFEIRGSRAYVAVPAGAIADIQIGKQSLLGEVRMTLVLHPGVTHIEQLHLRVERYRDSDGQLPHAYTVTALQEWRRSVIGEPV